jgi:drug/metabolite transporter (DMT)-like permease
MRPPARGDGLVHSAPARPLDAVATALMVVLCLSWGLNQVAVKLALPDIPALTQGALRSLWALPVVLLVARLRGVPLTMHDGSLAAGLTAGALFGVEFVFIFRGLVWTTASRAVVFIYTAPFFIALGARFLLHERLSPLQWGGLALSFLGILVAMGLPDSTVDARTLAGDGLMIAGGVFWAATTLVIKGSALARVATEKTTLYQLVMSALILAVGAVLFGERMERVPGPAALGWFAYQAVWVLGITFTVWFALVVKYSASRLSAMSFLTPLFGVAAGHFIMGDPLTPTFAAAVIFVVAGLVLVNRPR